MELHLRVKLINGDTHVIRVEDVDPQAVARKIQLGHEPFNREWLEAGDAELVRVSAIVSVHVEPTGGEPLIGFGNRPS